MKKVTFKKKNMKGKKEGREPLSTKSCSCLNQAEKGNICGLGVRLQMLNEHTQRGVQYGCGQKEKLTPGYVCTTCKQWFFFITRSPYFTAVSSHTSNTGCFFFLT